jgi:hypothetical protein
MLLLPVQSAAARPWPRPPSPRPPTPRPPRPRHAPPAEGLEAERAVALRVGGTHVVCRDLRSLARALAIQQAQVGQEALPGRCVGRGGARRRGVMEGKKRAGCCRRPPMAWAFPSRQPGPRQPAPRQPCLYAPGAPAAQWRRSCRCRTICSLGQQGRKREAGAHREARAAGRPRPRAARPAQSAAPPRGRLPPAVAPLT